MNTIIKDIQNELKNLADDKIRESSKRFFKDEIRCHGIKTAVVTRIGKEYFKKIKNMDKPEIFALCGELWKTGYMEESCIACNWSYYIHENYEMQDIKVFETWIENYVNNWASCDTLCNHTVGSFIDMYPDRINVLKQWAKSDNRWMRRAAAVSLIIPAKKGRYIKDIFEIAGILLTDSDDMVQKGYGWMLKAASQSHCEEVYDYVIDNRNTMPRTALRYAIEKMPGDLRAMAMKK